MREILFRGKQIDNGEWVYGYFVKKCDVDAGLSDFYIVDVFEFSQSSDYCGRIGDCVHSVITETVGQYTGLTDKNGKKIFEGDILDCKSGLYERCEVIFNEFCSAFQLMCADGFSDFFLCSINHKKMEIIGNIHDNPELLGAE